MLHTSPTPNTPDRPGLTPNTLRNRLTPNTLRHRLTLNTLRHSLRNKLTLNVILLILFTIGIGFYFIGMPKISDDYMYLEYLRPWFEKQGIMLPENGGNIFTAGIPWQEIRDSVINRYEIDNMRLGNILVHFFLLLPKWVGASTSTFMVLASLLLSLRIAGVNIRKSLLTPLAIFFWTFLMPWWINDFGSLDYQFNYIPPTFLLLLLFRILQKRHTDTERGHESETSVTNAGVAATASPSPTKPAATGPGYWLSLIFLSVLISFWHEGISAPAIGALSLLFIFYPRWRKPDVAVVVIILLVCTLPGILCPGMIARFKGQVINGPTIGIIGKIVHTAKSCFIGFIALSLTIWTYFRHKNLRKTLFQPIPLFFFAIGIFTVIILEYTYSAYRLAVCANASFAIFIFYILLHYPRTRSQRLAKTLSYTSAYLSIIFLACVAVYAVNYRILSQQAFRNFVEKGRLEFYAKPLLGDRFHIFSDYPYNVAAPLFSELYYKPDDNLGGKIFMIPETLSETTASSGTPASDNGLIRNYKGYYFMPYNLLSADDLDRYFAPIQIDYGSGFVDECFLAVPYRSYADNQIYVWVLPHIPNYHFQSTKIQRLNYDPTHY